MKCSRNLERGWCGTWLTFHDIINCLINGITTNSNSFSARLFIACILLLLLSSLGILIIGEQLKIWKEGLWLVKLSLIWVGLQRIPRRVWCRVFWFVSREVNTFYCAARMSLRGIRFMKIIQSRAPIDCISFILIN